MNRNQRTMIVLAVAVLTAGLASYGVYHAIRSIPVREVEVAHAFVVAAARPVPMGARLTAADVKTVPWPQAAQMPGAFAKVEDVVGRGVLVPLLENEPLTEGKLAPTEAGAGLATTIPSGMRAISVRVNEVIGVAGFVTPGTRVDVFATLQQQPTSETRVIVSNVQVLAAGTRLEQDPNKPREAIPSSVVTLLLRPDDAERVVLASTEGQIMLALRNPLDVEATTTAGTKMASIFSSAVVDREAPPEPSPEVPAKPVRVAPRPAPAPAPATAPPAKEPKVYTVDTIRGAKRVPEIVRLETEGPAR